MRRLLNQLKKVNPTFIRQHVHGILYFIILIYCLFYYIKYGFIGIDFGHTHDEHRILGSIIESVKQNLFLPGWYNYPSLTYVVSLLVSFLNVIINVLIDVGIPTNSQDVNELKLSVFKFAKANHINVHFVIRKVFFIISLLGSLSLYFTARLNNVRIRYAILATLFSLCSFQLFYHSRWIAPDQLLYATNAFWLLAILSYCKTKKIFNLLIASIVCSLVLSAKYQGGILLFVLIFISLKNRLSFKSWLAVLALYVTTFILITPACIVEPVKFLSDVFYEIQHYSVNSHGIHKVEKGSAHLLKLIDYIVLKCCSSQPIISLIVMCLSITGSYFIFKENKEIFIILVATPILYVLYFSTQSMMIVRNYLFIFPFLFILAAIGLDRLSKTVSKKYVAIFSSLLIILNVSFATDLYKRSSLSVHSKSKEWKEKIDAFVSNNPNLNIAFSKSAKKYVSLDQFSTLEDKDITLDFLVCDIEEFLQFSRKYASHDSIPNAHILGEYRGQYEVLAGPNEMDINHYPNWPGKSRLMSIKGQGANLIWFYFQNDSSIVLTN